MDAFKINWNDKMKKDVFVNKILNGDTSKDYFSFDENENGIWNHYAFLMSGEKAVSVPEALKWYARNKNNVRNWRYFSNTRLYDNTAPHSLYNLRYASLR